MRNVSAITLRSGKKIEVPIAQPTPEKEDDPATLQRKREAHAVGPSTSSVTPTPSTSTVAPSIPLPFPRRAIPSKKMEEVDREILETFRKVEVNISLLDAIKHITRFAKFLKELCTHNRRLRGNKKISIGRNVLALIGKFVPQIPEKCKDPSTFCVPCIICNNKFENAMLDLCASINVMPLSIFKSLSLGPLQPTGVLIQLANTSVAHPTGLVDDVLVRVGVLIFPVDFYILDIEEGFSHGSSPIILGRPFLKTARTKIDLHTSTLSMEFDDIVVCFNILDAMKHPSTDHYVFHVDIIDDAVDAHIFDFHPLHRTKYAFVSKLSEFAFISVDYDSYYDYDYDFNVDSEFESLGVVPYDFDVTRSECTNHVAGSTYASDCYVEVQAVEPISPSPLVVDIQPPSNTLELKPLPDNLKYVYLEEKEKLPVIISTSLTVEQE